MTSFLPNTYTPPLPPRPALSPPKITIFPRHNFTSAIHPITTSGGLITPHRASTTFCTPTKPLSDAHSITTTSSPPSSSSSSFFSSSPPPIIHRLELVSLAPSSNLTSSCLSLVVRVQYQPTKIHDAILLWPETTKLWYPPTSTTKTTILTSIDSQLDCTRTQHDMIQKILSKAPQYIFQDPNFGNPWYILEIQEMCRGEPRFSLVAKYAYQLLISSLKDTSQLVLRTPVGFENRHWLYERFDLHYAGRLGKLAFTGYLKEDNTKNTSKLVFIKTLDISAGPEKDGKPAVDRMGQVNSIYQEINLLNSIPGHPNLTPPPIGYVTLGSEEGVERKGRKIIGYVNQYYENGRLSEYIFLPQEFGKSRAPKPITVTQKAKWALQITSAVMHLHREAGVSMGDGGRGFGLERFMVDKHRQLHLGGFGASEMVARTSWRVPPEVRVRGEWEVNEDITSDRDGREIRKLVWRHNKYIRLRWEQDNLKKFMGNMVPFLTPPSSPTGCNSYDTSGCTDCSTNSGSINNNSTIGKSSRDSYSNVRKSRPNSFDSYDSYKSSENYIKALNSPKDGNFDMTNAGKEGRGNKGIDKNWSAFEEWHLISGALEAVETYSLGVMLWLVFEQVLPESLPAGDEDLIITWSVGSRIPHEWRNIVEACVKKNPADRVEMKKVLGCFVGEVGRRWDGGWFMG